MPCPIQSLYVYSAWGALPPPPGVRVHVHEAGHDVHAGHVDLTGRVAGAPVLVDGHAGEAHGLDPGDPVTLDDDIHGAHGRGSGAVDDRGATQDQPLVRAVPLVCATGRGWVHLRGERGGNGDRHGECESGMADRAAWELHPLPPDR